jgi:glycerophosphoryl diester phosphodiesterase
VTRGDRSRVIAHRGASGYLPEHTLEAKCLAYGMGSDYLEQDVVATRDRELVVLHDIWLEHVSDVADRFPNRQRPDGHYYVIDFEWPELAQLNLHERRVGRDHPLAGGRRFGEDLEVFRIVRLADEIRMIRELNAISGKGVGIYPEIKEPAFHRQHDCDITIALLELLDQLGTLIDGHQCYVQCFDRDEVGRLHAELGGCRGLILLLGEAESGELVTVPDRAATTAQICAGVGLPYGQLLREDSAPSRLVASAIVGRLNGVGLEIHPYTFRADLDSSPAQDFAELIQYFCYSIKVEALFTDHPDKALDAINRSTASD